VSDEGRGGLARPLVPGNRDINIGHGMLGWTMTYGSGRAVTDVVQGKKPEIDFDGLIWERYG
jgi:D-amino-acid dehydrogenase